MNSEHKEKLAVLSDKLMNLAVEEIDPQNWQGANKRIQELSEKERGARYWDKKNAGATLALLCKIQSVINFVADPSTGNNNGDDFDMGKRVVEAEKAANEILNRVMKNK